MSLKKTILMATVLFGLGALINAAEGTVESPVPVPEHAEAHGLPSAAVPLFNVGPLPVTNSMLGTWIVALGLIIFAQPAMRTARAVPVGARNFWEGMVEPLNKFLEGSVGPKLCRK